MYKYNLNEIYIHKIPRDATNVLLSKRLFKNPDLFCFPGYFMTITPILATMFRDNISAL